MELNEALLLVADFLQRQKLTKTYKALVEEAGLFDAKESPAQETSQQVEFWISSGDWPTALKFIQSACFKDARSVHESFYAHLI